MCSSNARRCFCGCGGSHHLLTFCFRRCWLNRVSYLLIVRGFRVFALLSLITRWRLMARTLIHVIPATVPILALQFLVCSLFSLLGMHLFGGLVYDGNPALAGTEYLTLGFETFNYNDYASAMATSFNLCVVNKWYVIMDGYATATNSRWTRTFFIAFWAVAVVFTLNVVVAFFTEAFTSQMEKAERMRDREMRLRNADELPTLGRKRSGGNLPFRATKSLSYYDLYEDIIRKTWERGAIETSKPRNLETFPPLTLLPIQAKKCWSDLIMHVQIVVSCILNAYWLRWSRRTQKLPQYCLRSLHFKCSQELACFHRITEWSKSTSRDNSEDEAADEDMQEELAPSLEGDTLDRFLKTVLRH